jgi:hypothetical protein
VARVQPAKERLDPDAETDAGFAGVLDSVANGGPGEKVADPRLKRHPQDVFTLRASPLAARVGIERPFIRDRRVVSTV